MCYSMGMSRQAIDISGVQFGRWTALERGERRVIGATYWLCRCECGVEREVTAASLRGGISRSCGCWKNELAAERYRAREPSLRQRYLSEHGTWTRMRRRCSNPLDKDWRLYGERGIKACERWDGSFKAFLADMGDKPSPRHSIDRIDNNGDYEPGNCRWATPKEQARNTRRTRLLTYQGQTRCLREWAEVLGMAEQTLSNRIHRGWSVEDALTRPVDKKMSRGLANERERDD